MNEQPLLLVRNSQEMCFSPRTCASYPRRVQVRTQTGSSEGALAVKQFSQTACAFRFGSRRSFANMNQRIRNRVKLVPLQFAEADWLLNTAAFLCSPSSCLRRKPQRSRVRTASTKNQHSVTLARTITNAQSCRAGGLRQVEGDAGQASFRRRQPGVGPLRAATIRRDAQANRQGGGAAPGDNRLEDPRPDAPAGPWHCCAMEWGPAY